MALEKFVLRHSQITCQALNVITITTCGFQFEYMPLGIKIWSQIWDAN